jgi:hypothetical protein
MATTTRTTDDHDPIPTKRLTLDELDELAGLTRPPVVLGLAARLRMRLAALEALAALANAPEVRR